MICSFCGQWNPDDKTVRCAFCRNPPGAEADGTIAGRVTMTGQQLAAIPKALPSQFDKPGASVLLDRRKPLSKEKLPLGAKIGIGIVVIGLLVTIIQTCLHR